VSTQPDDPIPADLLPDLLEACREIARMKHPSIEHLLRHRGFGFEADRIADLVLAIEALDGHRDAD
jgi:hypothetical protein